MSQTVISMGGMGDVCDPSDPSYDPSDPSCDYGQDGASYDDGSDPLPGVDDQSFDDASNGPALSPTDTSTSSGGTATPATDGYLASAEASVSNALGAGSPITTWPTMLKWGLFLGVVAFVLRKKDVI
jgi:hypothetical protein